jgi:hypothetical protein
MKKQDRPGPGPRNEVLLTRQMTVVTAEFVGEEFHVLQEERDELARQVAELTAALDEANTRAQLAEALEAETSRKGHSISARAKELKAEIVILRDQLTEQYKLIQQHDQVLAQVKAERDRVLAQVEVERDELAVECDRLAAKQKSNESAMADLRLEVCQLRTAMGLPVESPGLPEMDDSQPWFPCPHLLIACQARLYWRCVYLDWKVCPQKLNRDFPYERCPGWQRVQDNPMTKLLLLALL